MLLNDLRKLLQEKDQGARVRGIPLNQLVLKPIKQQLMLKPVRNEIGVSEILEVLLLSLEMFNHMLENFSETSLGIQITRLGFNPADGSGNHLVQQTVLLVKLSDPNWFRAIPLKVVHGNAAFHTTKLFILHSAMPDYLYGSIGSTTPKSPAYRTGGEHLLHRRRFGWFGQGSGPWWTPLPCCHRTGGIYRLPLGNPSGLELFITPAVPES